MASLKTLQGLSLVKLQERATRLGIDTTQHETKASLAQAVFAMEAQPTNEPEPQVEQAVEPKAPRLISTMKSVRSAIRAMVDAAMEAPGEDVRRHLASATAGVDIVVTWNPTAKEHTFCVPGEMRGNDQRAAYAWLRDRLGFLTAGETSQTNENDEAVAQEAGE